MRPFQIGLLIAFAVIAVVSVIVLASFKGFSIGTVNPYGDKVVIWGTFSESTFTTLFQEISRDDKNFVVVSYVEKDERTFNDELVNAIADGNGPDAIILNHESLVTLRSKLQPIPYSSFSTRFLKDNYIDGAEIFARDDGLYAIPFMVDPLIMYWNRDLFSTGGVALPPATWENLTSVVERLTLRDATRNIQQGSIAFGEYQNVNNAKAALLTLLMQSGSRLIEEDNDKYVVAINQVAGQEGQSPLTTTLQFFVEFSNASSPLYSWNRTFQDDLTAFLGERLTLYLGFGSEVAQIERQNPNLNFDTTAIPQGSGATIKRVYGKFYGLALLKSSSNQQGTYQALLALANPAFTASLAEEFGLAPTERTTLAAGAADATRQTIFNQALIARGWLDPGEDQSGNIFKTMVDDVVSGRSKVNEAVVDTIKRLELVF